ncbi:MULTISPECIES: helix-turn-helix domain-containing protein [Burkholderiaceae]|jgi:transcriptional regulator with XRE-family HTH domain|uniref:helix-turn-helix domain-containing protein n=1 Tax=Burkholderiaceae TaxID=119060 RepID=UPI00076B4B06|nr:MULTISPECIES: helix-turn-helix transcriptional regulator [Burkholderiaceae]AME24402.1 XRE family transcriptional regulator [Burkholderia sp. PAMC 26561]AMM13622.1 XRE family transcriptional regulator [Burkholderia sp. PAMC 28687]MDP9154409.1 helix-turn-helix transcriptional regulator [Pseudomonadota bacterium]
MNTLTSTAVSAVPIGTLIKHWRERRRMSQLLLANEAEISSRHLSFIETGRASPSRAMVLRLAEYLDVPLRERNQLLTAAGFAPVFRERSLEDQSMAPARLAVEQVLKGHDPYPALAIDRHWNLISANGAVAALVASADPALLEPPVNVLRLSLHPNGLASKIANLGQWRRHLLERLDGQIRVSGDVQLIALRDELSSYPGASNEDRTMESSIAIPFVLNTTAGRLSFITTTLVFGTPVDVTLSELAIEMFFPADEATAAALKR